MRTPRAAAAAAAIVSSMLLPAAALAGPPADAGHPELSERLAELARPALRNDTAARQADAVGLPRRGPASLVRSGRRVLVEIRFDGGARGAVDELRDAGAAVDHVSGRYQTVTAAVDPARLREVANVPGVAGMTEVLAPIVGAAGGPVTSAGCAAGARTSEGDAQLRAAQLRGDLGVDGGGVKVGVLSDSFDVDTTAATRASGDVATGDLPGCTKPQVQVLDEGPQDGADEGRAMLQVVHDLAPGSPLAFASAFNGITSFADNIRALRASGAKVIVDDVTYLNEPMFQPGPIDVAIDDVASQGVSYFTAAGNNNIRSGGADVPSWESPAFRPVNCPTAVADLESCEDFDPSAASDNRYGISVAPGDSLTLALQWAEPWNGVRTDLDLFLLDDAGQILESSEMQNVGGTEQPFEILDFQNTNVTKAVHVVVGRYTGQAGGGTANPRLKLVLLQNGGQATAPTEYKASAGGDVVGPSIFGHNGAANASSVGAVRFSTTTTVENYSSRGPVTHYFGPVNGTTPAAAITPQVLAKPDIAATDCGLTTFFPDASGRFCGTSESAPHAAAVAALQLQHNPSLTPAQVRALQAGGADPVGVFGPEAMGAGLLDAVDAAPDPGVTFTGPAATNDTTPDIGFDGFAVTYTCSFNGAPASPCSEPAFQASSTPLAEGTYPVSVTATDFYGHSGTTNAQITIDVTRPVATLGSGPDGLTNDPRPTFAGFGSNEAVRFECRFDGGAFAPCSGGTSHQSATPLPDGPHTFSVRAVDAATNASDPVDRSFTVDTTRPTATIDSGPTGLTNDARPAFGLGSDDPSATFQCRFDNAPFVACGSGFQPLLPLADGVHVLSVRAVDPAENVSDVAERGLEVDTRNPRASIRKHPSKRTRSRKARFTYRADEAGAAFRCRFDRGRFRTCTTKTTRRGLKRGKHSFQVRATDRAGNTGPARTFRWRIVR